MALSPDISTTTLTGTYVDINGTAQVGSVRFTPICNVIDTDQNQIVVSQPITDILDNNGAFSVVLPVTNDTDYTPNPIAYRVEEIFGGGRDFFITLPAGQAAYDLADLSEAVDSATAGSFVTTTQYNTLLGTYNNAQGSFTTLDNAPDTADTATANAVLCTQEVENIQKVSLVPFMLMGL
jgi:hypothetical protein